MRAELCHLCGGWLIVMSWDPADIFRGVRHHNATRKHREARKACGL